MNYNSKLGKKIFAILAAVSLLFPFELSKTEAASTTLSKTVEYFIGQDGIVRGSGEQISFYFDVNLPETPTVKSAIIEVNGVSYNNSGNQTINVDLERGTNSAETDPSYVVNYTLAGTTAPRPFTIKYDAWQGGVGPMSNIVLANNAYDYTLYLKDISAGGTASFSIASAKLILTYNYSATGANFLKTTKFLVGQETGSTPDGTPVSKDFTLNIPEQSPAIESVFIEASGIAKGGGTGTISISVVNQGDPASYTDYSINLGGSTNITKFITRYDASPNILSADFPGSKNYTLYLRGTGFNTNLWNAKLIVTYKYTEGLSGLPISGYAISSTVNTGIAKGAAFNSLMWQGNSNGGKVRMQFASSNCPGGETDYPACSSGAWQYYGPSCAGGDSDVYVMDSPNLPVEIMCSNLHNNKRYFRYKVILCSNDCISAGANNPEVTDVIVNWAP